MNESNPDGVAHWPETSAESRQEIRSLILSGKTVAAIQLYRSIHRLGLADAKQEIESLIAAMFSRED